MCLSRPTFLLHCKTAEMSSSLKPRITKILIIGIIHNLILMRWSVTWHQTVTFSKCGKPPGRKLLQRHLIFLLFLSVFLPHFLLSAHCFALLCYIMERYFPAIMPRKTKRSFSSAFWILYHHYIAPSFFFYSNRKTTCTRKLCRLLSTPSPAPRHTILRSGPPPHPLIATNVRVCCGVSLGRVCAVQSVGSKCTRNAKSFWTLTACRVSEGLQYKSVVFNYQSRDNTDNIMLCSFV